MYKYKYKIYYWTYDTTLLDNLITFLIRYKACHFLSGIAALRIDCLYFSWKLQEFLEIQIHEFFNYNSNAY